MSDIRLTWVTRSFLDYRVPVYDCLNQLCGGQLTLIYSKRHTPERVQQKAAEVLGERSIGLEGEWRFGSDGREGFANRSFCLPWQPGLYRQVAASQPDALIADGFFRWTPAAIWCRIRNTIPLVVCYERTHHTERNAQWVRTFYRRQVMRWIDAMSCNGSLSADYTTTLGIDRQRITLGHMAADNDSLSAKAANVSESDRKRRRESVGATGTCLLYVGRMLKLKGLYELLDAWRNIENERLDSTLVMVGDGPELEPLRRRSSALGLQRIVFTGRVAHDEIADWYASADAFVIPTLEDNWSLVVPEAMSCGLPILCSRFNGCWPELVQESNGWVFDPLDADEFASTLRTAINDSASFPSRGEASRQIVSAYSPKTAAISIMDAIEIARQRIDSSKRN